MAETDVPVAQLNFTADEINERLAAVSDKADASSLTNKQDTLVSGSNIKTVNGASLLGEGDIEIQAGLVSGVNIKTVNGESLLGEGDIEIQAGEPDNFSAATSVQATANTGGGVTSGTIVFTKYAGWVQCRITVTTSDTITSAKSLCTVPAAYRPALTASSPTPIIALASNKTTVAGYYANTGYVYITASATGSAQLSGVWPAATP